MLVDMEHQEPLVQGPDLHFRGGFFQTRKRSVCAIVLRYSRHVPPPCSVKARAPGLALTARAELPPWASCPLLAGGASPAGRRGAAEGENQPTPSPPCSLAAEESRPQSRGALRPSSAQPRPHRPLCGLVSVRCGGLSPCGVVTAVLHGRVSTGNVRVRVRVQETVAHYSLLFVVLVAVSKTGWKFVYEEGSAIVG